MLAVSAQVPNGGFENWTNHGSYSEPTGWLTYNDVPTVGGPTVEPGSPGHPGNHYASITTRQSPGGVMAIQGWISASSNNPRAGFPYGNRPAALTGQWQYNIPPTDSAQVLVAFSKWDGSSALPIGIGKLAVTGAINGWTNFTVPISWLSAETPDTAYIQIVSSIDFGAAVIGSNVNVDDLAFSGSAGISEHAVQQPVLIIHPLADDVLQITSSDAGELQFFDAGGRLLATRSIQGINTTLSVSSLPKGLVLYRFIGQGGATQQGKWTRP